MKYSLISQVFVASLLIVLSSFLFLSPTETATSWFNSFDSESEICPSPSFGEPCQSSSNMCGQTSLGIYDCFGFCSAVAPSNSQCPNSCVEQNICSGGNVVNSCTSSVVQTCSNGCSAGACNQPPQEENEEPSPSQCAWAVCSLDDGINPNGSLTTNCNNTDIRPFPPGCNYDAYHRATCDIIFDEGSSCGVPPPSPPPPSYQCSDGVDNDGDGLLDYPNDPGCISSTDDNEYNVPPAVQASCVASPSSIVVGESSTWTVTLSNGEGTHTYSWSGTDNLSGTGSSVTKTYTTPGTKTASVTITTTQSSPFVFSCCTEGGPAGNYVRYENSEGSCEYCGPGPVLECELRQDFYHEICPNPPFEITETQTLMCQTQLTVSSQCSDGIDNDGDDLIDYPEDSDCSSAGENSEASIPQCADGIDNDGDSLIDTNDYGCSGVGDTSESPNPQCSDGIDNNGNGFIDYPNDPTCSSSSDNNEEIVPNAEISIIGPGLVRSGESATISWTAENIEDGSCSIAGTSGDSWDISGSSGSVLSSPLTNETIFTMQCLNLLGDWVGSTTTVRITPSFREI